MEAATLAQDKAQRIVDAMRASVAKRGSAGSTFDHVAREAGVSRGLLHYYFGTKERLLAEVVRRDTALRMTDLDAALSGAQTADDVLGLMVERLEDLVTHDPDGMTLAFELFVLSRRTDELGAEVAELFRRTQAQLAELLERKQADGVLTLHGEPEGVAAILFSLADGVAMRMLADPEADHGPTVRAGVTAARALLG